MPASGGAIAALVAESAKAIDQFNDLKDATGASIENISALDRIARETGGSFDTVSGALLKFNQILNDTDEESKRASQIFKALGLDAAKLKKEDPAEALRQVAVALDRFADDGNKGRALRLLLGKSVAEVAPLMKDLAGQTRLVASTTTEAAEEAEKFGKELARLNANAQDFARSLSTDLIIGINKAAKAMRESGLLEGIATLLTGDDEHKNNVRLVELTNQLLRAENELARSRANDAKYGDRSLDTAASERRVKQIQDEIKSIQSYRKLLDETKADAGSDNKPSLDLKPDGKKTKDPYAEATRYLENLQRQLEKTKELGLEEQTLAEIQSGRIGKVTVALQKELLDTARLIDLKKAEKDNAKASEDAAKKAADAAGKLVDEAAKYAREVEVPYERLQRQLEELRRAAESNPLISAETSARMGTKYWMDYIKAVEEANKELDKFDDFSKHAAENIQDALGEGLVNLMEGHFDNIGDAFVRMLNRMVAEAIAADLSRYMLGNRVKGGSGDGVLGALFDAGMAMLGGGGGFNMYGGSTGAVNSAIMSGVNQGGFGGVSGADMVTDALLRKLPSYDVGTDFVPYDQVALVHRGERIVPAVENNPGRGGSTVVHVNVQPPANTSRSSANQWGAEVGRKIQHALARNG